MAGRHPGASEHPVRERAASTAACPRSWRMGCPRYPAPSRDRRPSSSGSPTSAPGAPPHRPWWRYYFFSLFQKHNEVVNVWTHLLAALAVLLQFWAFVEAEGLRETSAYALPLLVVLSSITYLTFSLLAHLQSQSELSHYTFYRAT